MIETARLFIQKWTEAEADAFYELTQDVGFTAFPITDWRQKDVASALKWIREMRAFNEQTKMGAFQLRERETGALVGMVAIRVLELQNEDRPEITYRLRESAWGKGYATEAARAMLKYGFEELGFEEIAASITPDNEASIKVALKIGMKRTGSEILLGKPAEILRIRR
jgi:RimJ/RimL family protein N-acetyltransferase